MARLKVRGYTERPNYRPGDEVTFYVSSEREGTATRAPAKSLVGWCDLG